MQIRPVGVATPAPARTAALPFSVGLFDEALFSDRRV